MTIEWVTRAQGFMTSQVLSFISVHLSWVRRTNAGMYEVHDDSCFIVYILVLCMALCLLCSFFRRRLHVVYTRNQRQSVARSRYSVQMIHPSRPRDYEISK